MRRIAFATSNSHKWREARAILLPEVAIRPLDKGLEMASCPEPHQTLGANAQAKLRHFLARRTGDVFAEDTGLFVEALGGAPGVYSQRYAQLEGSDLGNVGYLLAQMEAKRNRRAYFRTAIALHFGGQLYGFEGELAGELAPVARGRGGFGYDSIFIPDGYKQTLAELPKEVKNSMSHRQQALALLKEFLRSR